MRVYLIPIFLETVTILPKNCKVQQLTLEAQNGNRALEMLCDALDAHNATPELAERRPNLGLPEGTLDQDKIAAKVYS